MSSDSDRFEDMTLETTIRRATDDDLDALCLLEDRCFSEPWSPQLIRAELHAPGRHHTVIVDDQETILGYLLSMWILDEIHINKIGVDPRTRREGLARKLMADCERFARDHQIELIRLEVRETNLEAIAFYESIGFGIDYYRPGYYSGGETAVVMSRSIR